MHYYLLLVILLQIAIVIFAYPITILIVILVLVIISYLKKVKALLLIIPLIILTYTLIPKVFEMPSNFEYQTFEVISKKTNYAIVKNNNNQLFLSYDLVANKGSTFTIDGYFQELSRINYPLLTEFADYLNNNGVFYEIVVTKKHNQIIKDSFRDQIINTLINSELKSANFLKLLVFSDRTESLDFYQSLKHLSIIHLFVISGFHINLIFNFLVSFFKLKKHLWIALIMVFPYLYLLDFTLPSIKAFTIILLTLIFKNKGNFSFDRLSIILLTFIIIVSFNPLALKSYSLLLSIIASLNIELIKNIKIKNKIIKYLINNILIYLGLLPIILYINYEFNFLAIVYNLVFAFLISPLFVLAFIVTFLKPFQLLFYPLVVGFENIVTTLTSYNTMFIMGKPSVMFIGFYYLNYYLLIINFEVMNIRRIIGLFTSQLASLTFQYYYVFITPRAEVSFLNVGHGDSILIVEPYSKNVVLVDTGGSRYYEVTKNRTIPYLKALGIKKIDGVIITHDDFDHNGSLPYLVNNFEVSSVLDGQTLKSYLNMTNLNYGNLESSDNNRSAVFYFRINKINFLLTGDIDDKVEKRLVEANNLKIDVLKVSHHGSRFGTSDMLLDSFQPNIAIISTSKNNPYRHPHVSVLQRLNQRKIKVLRTDIDGTITFSFNNFTPGYELNKLLKYAIIMVGEINDLFSLWFSKAVSR